LLTFVYFLFVTFHFCATFVMLGFAGFMIS